jgi:hypothetical protein
MVDNKDFFDKKKKWSTYKDSLLGCYLVPYYQKILISPYRSIYIDGFAGKGRFGDGSIGSPLIEFSRSRKRINCLVLQVTFFRVFLRSSHADSCKQ